MENVVPKDDSNYSLGSESSLDYVVIDKNDCQHLTHE